MGRPLQDPLLPRKVLDHLRAHRAGLTAFEIARALGLKHPGGHGATRVACECRRLAVLDLAKSETGPKDESDRRPVTRWWPA
jgi:hypothetical protein